MKDSADPLDGWPLSEVFSIHAGPRDDVNGKLYQYIRSCLVEFHGRLQALEVKFQLYQGDVRQVVPQLMDTNTKYDRIEVCTILSLEKSARGLPAGLDCRYTNRSLGV
jgi:hypothetical protein